MISIITRSALLSLFVFCISFLPVTSQEKVSSESFGSFKGNSCPEFFQVFEGEHSSYTTEIKVVGNIALASAGWETVDGINKAGAVYVYERIDDNWQLKQKLHSPEIKYDAIFGAYIATDGNFIVVTEPGEDKAHIFKLEGDVWVIDTTLQVSDNGSEIFGISCCIENGVVAIGSGAIFAVRCTSVGSVYIYEYAGSEWIEKQKLIPENGQPHDNFGAYLDISDGRIAIAADKAECYVDGAGYICIYEKVEEVWMETVRLSAPSPTVADFFGTSLDLDGNKLLVSAHRASKAYYFELEDNWVLKHTFTSEEETDNFGWPVSLNNDLAFISAHHDHDVATSSGAVYAYQRTEDGFEEICKIKDEEPTEQAKFGYGSMDSDGNTLIINGGYQIPKANLYKLGSSCCTCYDTTYITIIDTSYVTIQDTVRIEVQDTTYVTIEEYVSVTDTLIIDAVLTDISPPNDINRIKIYPNPANTHIFIHTGQYGLMAYYTIRIFNQQGITVFESPVMDQLYEVNLSEWTGQGLYYFQLTDPYGKIIDVRKIILE